MKSNNLTIFKEKLLHKGAEASLYYGHWFNKEVIFKQRIPKKYRIEKLDRAIRNLRTIKEARALIRVKEYGICVPQVYEINTDNSTIIMKYIEGQKLKNLLNVIDEKTKDRYFQILGDYIAKLHQTGQIHGDITTSNVIITETGKLFLIDFGLYENSDSIEDKSTDIHLLKRVLISSHGQDYNLCYQAFLTGYRDSYIDQKECNRIINNIAVIETRGRYIKKEQRQ
ncbi:MAG: Kae1-associated serine/threonine protein kinase [Candidatus Lokiarchaeota archaeon]|nr:Kae1-associated serine/threonine protein kinase [Candidatus Lokiarchaeota archaeon]MBD3337704.1 Kae1-associated serine/threonine protein kinase [Candidatus Lokiarchaeota archaeon]